VALIYNLPSKSIDGTFLTNASLSVIGSNLWIIDKIYNEDLKVVVMLVTTRYSVGSLPTTGTLVHLKLQFYKNKMKKLANINYGVIFASCSVIESLKRDIKDPLAVQVESFVSARRKAWWTKWWIEM